MSTNPVIEVENLSFSYNCQPVLEDINLSLPERCFTAFIGPNGGGKTTLLKLMLGLLKPDRGKVRVLGEPPRRVAKYLGYVPQDTDRNRSFPISVMEVVLSGRIGITRRRIGFSKEDRKAAEQALDQVGIRELSGERIGELSGGQRQRAFIARALAGDPRILFLDEPTAGVDAGRQVDFFRLLKELNQTTSIIMVNHDLMVISSHAKSVACVNRTLHYHDGPEITEEMIQMYQCPVELVAHGIPHRVLKSH